MLQQHILVNFVEGYNVNNNVNVEVDDQSDDDDDYITVFLDDNDKKSFNKFVLDTFSEIQHYYKYTIIVDEEGEGMPAENVNEEMEKLKKHGLSVEEYLKRIKGSCLKNNC